MNEEVALRCYEWAVKTDGQIDMILGQIEKHHLLKSGKTQTASGNDDAAEIVITGITSVLNEARNALSMALEERFQNTINGLDSAIMRTRKGEYSDAGQRLTNLASDPDAISNRALRKLFP